LPPITADPPLAAGGAPMTGYDGWGGRHGPHTRTRGRGHRPSAEGCRGGNRQRAVACVGAVRGGQVRDACSRASSSACVVCGGRAGAVEAGAHHSCGSRVTQPQWGQGVGLEPPRTRAPQMDPVESSRGRDCEGWAKGAPPPCVSSRVSQTVVVRGLGGQGARGDALRPRGAASGGGPGLGRCEWL